MPARFDPTPCVLSSFSSLQVFGDCFAKLLAHCLVASRRAVWSVPRSFQADGERVIIAVVGHPLTADFPPEGMVAGTREARIGLDGERARGCAWGDFEKQRSIFASSIAQEFRRTTKKNGWGSFGAGLCRSMKKSRRFSSTTC